MVHELSQALSKSESGVAVKLYSNFPFPIAPGARWTTSRRGRWPSSRATPMRAAQPEVARHSARSLARLAGASDTVQPQAEVPRAVRPLTKAA